MKLFGTDGIRGISGKEPLTTKTVTAIARAAGDVLRSHAKVPRRILLVRDTRASGQSLGTALIKGFRSQGIDVYDAGVLCTPAAAFLVMEHHFSSGVVISASHNPPEFNGIKFFNSAGCKWPDEWEREVEDRIFGRKQTRKGLKSGRFLPADQLSRDYQDFVVASVGPGTSFENIKMAMDCSNGANSLVAPAVFRRLGATVSVLGNKPNGKNINVNCGSQHLDALSARIKKDKCDFGVAFDGDADRVIFVDEKGAEVDGDHLLAILAREMKATHRLKNKTVVVTVMANLGLRKTFDKLGIQVIETAVGDRFVSEAMRKHGAVLGGEQSGHIILGEFLPSGDGLLTAVHVAAIAAKRKARFSSLTKNLKKYPQVLVNVRVKEKRPISELDGVDGTIAEVNRLLKGDGRVLVRYSGTEPLLRIMIEGPEKAAISRYAEKIADGVRLADR